VKLYPHQRDALAEVRQRWMEGHRGALVVMPTGAGKTVTFCTAATRAAARGKRTLIVVPRIELLGQTRRTLARLGQPSALVAAKGRRLEHGEPDVDPSALVTVASAASLIRRPEALAAHWDQLVLDEAHLSRARTYQTIVEAMRGAWRLLATATPDRTDGQGYAPDLATAVVVGPQIAELQAMGKLCPVVAYAPPAPDLTGARTEGERGRRFNRPELVDDTVAVWFRLCEGRRGIAFSASCDHARATAARMRSAGLRWAAVTSDAPQERVTAVAALRRGDLDGLSNYGILVEGFDCPEVNAVIFDRHTTSKALFYQGLGRGLRVCEGKTDCIVVDKGGNFARHGAPWAEQDYSEALQGRTRRKLEADPDAVPLRTCVECFAVWSQGAECPRCGAVPPPAPRKGPKLKPGVQVVLLESGEARATTRRPAGCSEEEWAAVEKVRLEKGYHWKWSHHQVRLQQRREAARGAKWV